MATTRMMGVETEYAVMAQGRRGKPRGAGAACDAIMERAARTLTYLPGNGGLYLGNGSRFYRDIGAHPELSTPEVPSPGECVRHIEAGHRIMRDLAASVSDDRGIEVSVFTINVDYAQPRVTWAYHESYQHRADPDALPDDLIPHLVTRLYLSAGGINPHCPGIELCLCPRALQFVTAISACTTHHRGIFNTRQESLASGNDRRLHVICGDSVRSHAAQWLRLAGTRLIVTMAEAGLRPGHAVRLADPVKALHAISLDPTLTATVKLADGRALTALEIQRHYLETAQASLHERFMPSWAAEACRRWSDMLDRAARGPGAVDRTLDWAIKHAIMNDHLARAGVCPETLAHWNHALTLLDAGRCRARLRRPLSDRMIRTAKGPLADAAAEGKRYLADHGLKMSGVGTILGLRGELAEIDMRFGQVASAGIFDAIEPELDHRVPDVSAIDEAKTASPSAGRARLRSQQIQRLAGTPGCSAGWTYVRDADGRTLRLGDPTGRGARWMSTPQEPHPADRRAYFEEML